MGNSGSGHQQQITLVEGPPHSWAHSFPRTTSFKVLPDRVPGQRLRLTNNGAILHNGGTISGRKPYPFEPPIKNYHNPSFQTGQDYRRTLYGSEPDLRYSRDGNSNHTISNSSQTYYNNNNDNSVKSKIGRSRKKYKAPPAPNVNSADSSSPDSYHRWETSADSSDVTTPSRRSRLFKTRAETKRPSVDNAIASKYHSNAYSQIYKPGAVPGQLQRSLSSPQFQDELTAKLRERAIREPPVGRAADSPRSSPVSQSRENATPVKRHAPKLPHNADTTKKFNGKANNISDKLSLKNQTKAVVENGNLPSDYCIRVSKEASKRNNVEKSRNHSKTEHQNGIQERPASGLSNEPKEPEAKKSTTPVKKFYFGMEAEAHSELAVNGDTNEVVDKFAAMLRKSAPILNNTSPSESFSSEPTNDDNSVGISLKLRPTLPRKQLDIPRFSPTAAWRLLSALESPIHSEEDDLVLIEDQIPHPHVEHQLADKSGDSGISGDASPQHQDSTHNSQVAWTPQQDLEETSSDGGLESAPVSPESIGTAKFSPRFSLSLPRDERLPAYSSSDKLQPDVYTSSNFQNLKKLKRSVSGALGRNKEVAISSLDENWLLSRSVPNLFHNSYGQRWSDMSPSSGEQEDDRTCSLSKPSSFSYLANGGHIMYLPEYKNAKHSKDRKVMNAVQISKSCEDLTHHQNEKMLDYINNYKESNGVLNQPLTDGGGRAKNRKFTFQSTIRQIERRRIAEKLSKEAEEKEKRRLRELEAMKKVEEEFQRKREREKADIRHQLRLYNLTEGGREQPDGAVVSPPAPSTQILSEYRQPRRDYRDYMPIRADLDSVSHSDSGIKRETIHPEVIYKMPKNTQVYVTPHHNSGNSNNFHLRVDCPKSLSSDNYRKDFAQGALSHSVASSDSELSQPNTRPTSRTKQRSRSPSLTSDEETKNFVEDPVAEKQFEEIEEYNMTEEKCTEKSNNYAANIENLTKIFSTGLQPFNRNKTYKPVSFKPFSDKIAQVTS